MALKDHKREAVEVLEKQIAELEKSAPSTACREEVQRLREQIEALHEENHPKARTPGREC